MLESIRQLIPGSSGNDFGAEGTGQVVGAQVKSVCRVFLSNLHHLIFYGFYSHLLEPLVYLMGEDKEGGAGGPLLKRSPEIFSPPK